MVNNTDVSRLLSELSQAAGALNHESDSLQQLIQRFEERLRQTNIGIEVWCLDELSSSPIDVPGFDEEGEVKGTECVELGWAKGPREWELWLRKATYRPRGMYTDLYDEEDWMALRQASRKIRIEALRRFPALLQAMIAAANEAVKTIEQAKHLVELC